MTNPSFTQIHFRLRYDDGNETGATWAAAEDTAATLSGYHNFRVRFTIDETASRAWTSKVWNLYYSKNGGSYLAVSASTPIQFAASSNFTDGADCTRQLTAPTGTFVSDNNGMKETTGGATNSGSAGYFFETEWCLLIDPAQSINGDYYDLRIFDSSTPITTYSVTPRITAKLIEPAPTDGLTIGESKTVEITTLYRSVTDGLTVGDTLTDIEVEDLTRTVVESDDVVLGDSVSYYIDEIILGEAVTVTVEELVTDRNIDKTDNVTVGESKTVENTTLYRSASDGLTVGESKTVENTTLYINTSDGVTVGDSKTVENTTLYRSVTDGLTVGDSLTDIDIPEAGAFTIDKTDGITVGESKTVENTTLYRSISNDVWLGDSAQVNLTRTINVADSVAAGEETGGSKFLVTVGSLAPSNSDNVAIGESKTVALEGASEYNVDVTDGVALGEPTGAGKFEVTVSSLQVVAIPPSSQNVLVGESVTVSVSVADVLSINVSDSVALDDSLPKENIVTSGLVINILAGATGQTIAVGDSANVSVGTAEDYSINKTDDVTIGESAGVLLPETGAISILIPAGSTGNIVAVGESKTLEVKGGLNPDRIDYVIVGDSANVQIAYTINEIDYVSVAEPSGSGKREVVVGSLSTVIAAGATGNTVAVGENVNVAIFTPGLIEIAKADNLTLGELVQVAVVLVIGAGCAKSYDSLVHSVVIDDVAYHSIEIDDTAYHSVDIGDRDCD